jgi:hypothetical protein
MPKTPKISVRPAATKNSSEPTIMPVESWVTMHDIELKQSNKAEGFNQCS